MAGPSDIERAQITRQRAIKRLEERERILQSYFNENKARLKQEHIIGISIEPWGEAGYINVLSGQRGRTTCVACHHSLRLISPYMYQSGEGYRGIYECYSKSCKKIFEGKLRYRLPLNKRDLKDALESANRLVFK